MGAMLAQLSKGASVEFGFPEVTSFSLVKCLSQLLLFLLLFFFHS